MLAPEQHALRRSLRPAVLFCLAVLALVDAAANSAVAFSDMNGHDLSAKADDVNRLRPEGSPGGEPFRAKEDHRGLWLVEGLAVVFALGASWTMRRRLPGQNRQSFGERDEEAEGWRSLPGRLVQAQEEERRRIARELHDDFGQRLAGLLFQLSCLREQPGLSGECRDRLAELTPQLSAIASDLQRLSRGLHSAVLENIGLAAALRSECMALSKSGVLDVSFHASQVPPRLPPERALSLYRVAQEAIQNALKHSQTRRLEVELQGAGGLLLLRVRDFGVGFRPDAAVSSEGLGLTSLRERMRMSGGSLSIISRPGGGATIEARVPSHPRLPDVTASARKEARQ